MTRYAYDLDQEASAQTDEKKIKLPPGWPSKGQLELKELSYKYRPSTPLVLNSISVKIEAGSKVGVVGRTGAGKTSLFSAILRLAEIEAGEVLVDEVDVSQIGLGDLRSAIAVIPQDPVLFQGMRLVAFSRIFGSMRAPEVDLNTGSAIFAQFSRQSTIVQV